MAKEFKFTIIFIVIGIFAGSLFVLLGSFISEKKLFKQTTNNLDSISQEKAGKVEEHLKKMKFDIESLKESKEVKNLLSEELVFDEFAIKKDVDGKTKIVAKEIENYLRSRPGMSIRDLQTSPEFQRIAVQPVGKDGYTIIGDLNSMTILFDKFPGFIDFDIREDAAKFKGVIDLVSKLSGDAESSEGFFDWIETEGEIEEKYGKFIKISTKPSGSGDFFVGAAALVDEYKAVDRTSEYLENFMRQNAYHNIILISADGYVSYMAEKEIGLGTNLSWKENSETDLAKSYIKAVENMEILFYGPYISIYGDIYPKINVLAPVSYGDRFLGYVGIIEEMDEIFAITKDTKNLEETGQSFLINKDQLLISPLRNQEFDIMVQAVDTENSEECIEDLEEKGGAAFEEEFKEKEEGEETRISENYKGEVTIGTDFPLPRMGWCLLVEIDKAEAVDIPLKKSIKRKIFFTLSIVLALAVAGFLVGKYHEKLAIIIQNDRKTKRK